MNTNSFTAADVQIPAKVLQDIKLVESVVKNKRIPLRHLQLCPTNKCNLNCKFCSCADRDISLMLSYSQIMNILIQASEVGCESVTITGGGEPLLHPRINDIIDSCYNLGIKVGLVTNGIALEKLDRKVDWCRISVDSTRDFDELKHDIRHTIELFHDIDWAFSYVLYESVGGLPGVVEFANSYNFTHVRVVSDILSPNDDIMLDAKKLLEGIDERVIYQARSNPTRGAEKCWISLLKPTVGADGEIYPCCGVQYALNDSKRDFTGRMSMGTDIKDINEGQKVFNGSICDKCYYSGYNQTLDLLMKDIKHPEWV